MRTFRIDQAGCAARLVLPGIDMGVKLPHLLEIGLLWSQRGPGGGVDRIYRDLVDSLPGAGFRVSGAVLGAGDVRTAAGSMVYGFSSPKALMVGRYLGARRLLSRLMRTEGIDLVAVHFALYAALALDHMRDRPLVMHFHGPWSSESAEEGSIPPVPAAKRYVEAMVYRRADRVIVLSEVFADLVVRDFQVPRDRVRLVPGHVDLEQFAPRHTREAARAILGWPADRPILLSVRRLQQRMGLDRLIAAMQIVVKAVPDVLLCIGGTGPLGSALSKQVAEAGLGQSIRFLGYIPEKDLPDAYRAADFNVVPSVALEGFGLVAAEALAAGTPSLVTPVGGLPEVVAPLSDALVFRSSAVKDLADGLIGALLGRGRFPDDVACRDYANKHFALTDATARVAAVYREVLG